VIKTLEAQVGHFLLRCKCPVSHFLPGRAKDLSAPRVYVRIVITVKLSLCFIEHRAFFCVISDFRREVHENCALLGYYATSSGNVLPTFRDNLSVASSGVKNPLKMGPIGCPKRSVRNYYHLLRNNPDERSSHHALRLWGTRTW
jgi:hypothetical protein